MSLRNALVLDLIARMDASSDEDTVVDVGSRSQSRSCSPDPEQMQIPRRPNSHIQTLVRELNKYRENNTFCDVILVVDGRRFPAHKHVLSAASDYFSTMFGSNFRERDAPEVKITGVDCDIFNEVIQFMYTGIIKLTNDIFEDVFRVASLFLLDELMKNCEEFGEITINNSNCVSRYKIAEELGNTALEEASCMYVRSHFSELVESDELFVAPYNLVTESLGCEMLNIKTEEQVCKFVLQYLDVNWEELKHKDILPLFSSLCLETLHPAYIKTWIIDNEFVQTSQSLLQYLLAVHDHLAYNLPLPDTFVYQEVRRLATPTRGIFLFGGKPSITGDNNCQFIHYETLPEGDCDRFDLDVKIKTKNVSKIPMGKCEFAAACSIKGDIYISGLGPKLDDMWKYESALNQWLRCSKMLTPRCRHVMVCTTPNILFVLGGAQGYQLSSKDGNGGDPFNVEIDEYNKHSGRWTNKGYVSKSILHPCALYWNGVIFIFGGAHSRGRDFTRFIQKYDPKTETTVTLSLSLPISVHCPKAVVIGRTAVIVGFHNSVTINMDGLTAVHAVNMSETSHHQHRECKDKAKNEEEDQKVDTLDASAECMTVRQGSKVAWFGLELLGRDLFVIGGQNTDSLPEKTVKRMNIDDFLSDDPHLLDAVWHKVGRLQQEQRFCTVTGLGYHANDQGWD